MTTVTPMDWETEETGVTRSNDTVSLSADDCDVVHWLVLILHRPHESSLPL